MDLQEIPQNPPEVQGFQPESGVKHGSGNVETIMERAAAQVMGAPSEILIHGNAISDDSLVLSPVAMGENSGGKRRSRSPVARSESAGSESRRRRGSSSGSRLGKTLKTVQKMGVRRPSSAPRGSDRPPSPMLPALAARIGEPPQPGPLQGGFGGVYENVAKLEEQQSSDRAFVAQLARAVRSLEQNFSAAHRRLETVESELCNPRRDLAIRQEMRDTRARLEAEMAHGHETTHNVVGTRMAETQVSMTELQVAMSNFKDKEAQIEAYLAGLESDRPREGQKVISGFELVQS